MSAHSVVEGSVPFAAPKGGKPCRFSGIKLSETFESPSFPFSPPKETKELVIAGSPASLPLFVEGGKRLLAQLPPDVRKTLEGDGDGNYETPKHERASVILYARHVYRIDPLQRALQQAFVNLKAEPTAYNTMKAPSDIVVDGNLKY
ncbi:hypothetical protein DL768_009333 [Monosporascus sp. mg162]|nr:hypothetical protein DL768_009333 [Monosporascus sp. mg162]